MMERTLLYRCLVTVLAAGYVYGLYAQDTCFWQRPGLAFMMYPRVDGIEVRDMPGCGPAPRLIAFSPAYGRNESYGGAVAYVSDAGDLFVSAARRVNCVIDFCIPCHWYFCPFTAVSIPGINISQVTALEVTNTFVTNDTAFITIVLNRDAMQAAIIRLRINGLSTTPSCTVTNEASYSLVTLIAGQRLTGLCAGRDTATFYVYGERGLLREITYTDSIRETIFDIDPSETVTCVSDSFAGTFGGSIYRIADSQQVAQTGKTLRVVTEWGAAGDSGHIVERTASAWHAYDVGDVSIRYFEFYHSHRGIETILIDEAFRISRQFVRDSATRLIVESPPKANLVNAEPFRYVGIDSSLRIRFRLQDPEDNYVQPRVDITSSVATGTLTPFGDKYPECTCDTAVILADPAFSIVLSPDSLRFDASCRRSVCMGIGCYASCFWTPTSCSTSVPWQPGDTVSITTRADTVRVVFDPTYAVRPSLPATMSRNNLERAVISLARGIVPDSQRGMPLKVYDCRGRAINPRTGRGVIPAGVYVAGTGTVWTRVLSGTD